jgi:hypothetical protein
LRNRNATSIAISPVIFSPQKIRAQNEDMLYSYVSILEGNRMWGLEELRIHREIVDSLDWEMTPEKAVETYLEWGTGWARKDDFVRYPGQEALYFVIYDWEKPAQVTLIRRTMKEADEIAKIHVPEEMVLRAIDAAGRKPGVGVYAITEELKEWLKQALGC